MKQKFALAVACSLMLTVQTSAMARETACGYDGVEPAAAPAPAPTKLVIKAGALFDFDSDVCKQPGTAQLNSFAEKVKAGMTLEKLTIVGHTDSKGSDAYNDALGLRRANSVANYLKAKGVTANSVDIKGMGEKQPVDTNDTETGRANNRRVEITIETVK